VIATASANLGNFKDEVVLKGLKELAKQVSVIAVQEAGDRGRVLARFCDATGWMMYVGDEEGAPSVTILWDPQAVLVTNESTRPATDRTDCGKCGAGPDVVKAKVWNKIRVHPRNGDAPFVFINGHLPASIYCKCRKRLAKEMIEELADMFRTRKGHVDVVAMMDGNSFSWNPIWKPIRNLGAKQWVKFPTKGLRSIDMGWTLGRKAKARKFKGKYSDHAWVILELL
jgi:hypothetical protein